MKGIGFKNFRKFIDFPLIEFSPITIFVGGNNSGKSTTVKAIISVLSYLRNARFEKSNNILNNNFYFNQNPYAHIGTFKRAKCNRTDNNNIFFEIVLEELKFSFWLNGDGCDENTTYAKLEKIKIQDNNFLSSFEFDFQNNKCSASFCPNSNLYEKNVDYNQLCEKVKSYQFRVDNGDIGAQRMLARYTKQLRDKFPVVNDNFSLSAKITDVVGRRMIGGPLVSGMIYNTCYYFVDMEDTEDEDKYKSEIEKVKSIQNYIFKLSHRLDSLLYMYPMVEYIYAHAASQIVLYTSNDNNYLSRTIHDFANRRLDKNTQTMKFMKEWMGFLEIGIGFNLVSVGGEAHTFNIIDFDENEIPLADKGMGTIQLMILLLRLAVIINQRSIGGRMLSIPTTVIVEEPEQNLHPKKQSQLIEFFKKIYDSYKIHFIIETHSEYLIRRSQVMVAEKKYQSEVQLKSSCPFKVYYFPQNGCPYDMEFQTNGRFVRNFDNGFFDEASKYAILLSKIERGRV